VKKRGGTLYLKEPAGNGKFIITPLTDENVFSICPVCGEEHQVDLTELVMEPDFNMTMQVCCPFCTREIRKDGLDATLTERGKRLSNALKWAREDND